MKKSLIILANIGFVMLVMAFVLLYTRGEARSMEQAQMEAFESMTVAMEKVTANYLQGEQRLCDSWANSINSFDLDMEGAIDFLKTARTMPEMNGHVAKPVDMKLVMKEIRRIKEERA